MIKVKNKYGFTLVEMIIVIAVAAFVLTPIGLMMSNGLRNEVNVNKTIEIDQTLQITYIHLNEKIRGEGFSEVEVLADHLGVLNVLKVNDKIYFVKSGTDSFVYQTYSPTVLLGDTEVILNEFVDSAVPKLIDNRLLEVVFEINSVTDDTRQYTYKIAKRE